MVMPKEWILRFTHNGGAVTCVVVARTDAGARAFAPTGATNVRVKAKRTTKPKGTAEE